MQDDRATAIEALLRDTEAAHAAYEKDELNGVYDEAWPAWYAGWAVEHGLGSILGRAVSTEELAGFLTRTWDEVRESGSTPAEPWSTWMARRIASDL